MYVSIVKDNISVVIHFKVVKLKLVFFIQRNRTTILDMSATASTQPKLVYIRELNSYVCTLLFKISENNGIQIKYGR